MCVSELCAGDAGRARLRELGQRKEKIAQISPFLCLFFHVFDVQITKGKKKNTCGTTNVWFGHFQGALFKLYPRQRNWGTS